MEKENPEHIKAHSNAESDFKTIYSKIYLGSEKSEDPNVPHLKTYQLSISWSELSIETTIKAISEEDERLFVAAREIKKTIFKAIEAALQSQFPRSKIVFGDWDSVEIQRAPYEN